MITLKEWIWGYRDPHFYLSLDFPDTILYNSSIANKRRDR